MKTIQQVQEKIESIKQKLPLTGTPVGSSVVTKEQMQEINQAKEDLEFYDLALQYLKTGPSQQFIESERERIVTKINNRMLDFNPPDNIVQRELRKMKTEHERKYNIPHLRKQLAMLDYLLLEPVDQIKKPG